MLSELFSGGIFCVKSILKKAGISAPPFLIIVIQFNYLILPLI